MAIRFRKEYGTWQVYWRNPITGKRESKSFDTENEAKKENSLITHRLKFEPESFRPKEEEPRKEEKTLEEVYVEYLCEKQFSKKDLATHRGNFRCSLDLLGNKAVSKITKEDLELVKRCHTQQFSSATANNRLRILRTILYYAVERGYCDMIKFPKIPPANYMKLVPPTPEEAELLINVAAPHIQRVIILGVYFGVRIGGCELFQLTWEDVDLQNRVLRVHGSKKNRNSPYREVPIRESLLPIVERWQKDDLVIGVQYLIHYKGEPVKSIKKAWAATLKRAGITRRIRPYDLRHTFATELIAAGADIGTVAQLMGHSNPNMLLSHYQYVLTSQKTRAIESLPDLPCVPHLCAAEKQSSSETT